MLNWPGWNTTARGTGGTSSRLKASVFSAWLAAMVQMTTMSGGIRRSSAPMATLAMTKAAEPQPRGTEKLNPPRRARRRFSTSIRGIRAEAAVAPTNQPSPVSQKSPASAAPP